MDLLQHLETYITAQKGVGMHFVLIGIGLLIIASLSHFFGESPLANGLKIGALICGLLILIGGIGYRITEDRLLGKQTELFHNDMAEFQQVETERMVKVVKEYPVYQMVFGSFIILALLVVWFVKNPFWHGVAFAVIILCTCVMISEAFSQLSIRAYHDILTE